MAKSKWEQLHAKMNTIMKDIEEHIQMIKEFISHYNVMEMHFHRELLNPDQLPLNYPKYMEIAKTQCIFLKILCSDEYLKKEFQKTFLKHPHFYLPVRSIPDTNLIFKKIVRWSVRLKFADEIISKLNDLPFELFLYCASRGEYGERQKWFEKDNKMNALNLESLQEQIVLENLAGPVEKYFKAFMRSTTLLENPKQSLPYKPLPGESIKTALATAVICRYTRKFGTSYDLFKDWEEELQALVFQGTNWPFEEKYAYFQRMKRYIIHNHTKSEKEKDPEYTQTVGELFRERIMNEIICFDKCAMAGLIQLFAGRFIQDLYDKKSGQIACILWLSIWLSHEIGDEGFLLENIIELSSKEINFKNKSLIINGKEIKISLGLMKLVFILLGKGKGKRARRLFPDITKRNLKNALKNAFKSISPYHASSFSLNSLLYFPHPFVGNILPASLLKKMRNPDVLAGKIGDLKGTLLKGYKEHISH